MIRDYPARGVDVALMTFSEMNLGVRSLSSVLKENGFSTAVGFFDGWQARDDAALDGILRWVRETGPRIVGVSTAEASRAQALRVIDKLRGEGRTVVAGGVDATLNPGIYLESAGNVIRGEGEPAMVEFVGGKDRRDIANLWFLEESGEKVKNDTRPVIEDLDALPHEDWLDTAHHFELRGGTVRQVPGFARKMRTGKFNVNGISCFTLRGCAFSCTFCSNHAMGEAGQRVRKRSIRSVIARIEELKRADPSLGMVYFFEDDFFLRTLDEIREFSAEWKKKIDVPFFAYGSPVTVEEEKLKLLAEAGLLIVNVGIQTGSERINEGLFGRRMKNSDAIQTSALIRKYVGRGRFGLMPPVYDLIMNNPYETEDDIRETINLVQALPGPYLTFMNSLVLFQGTKLHERAAADGLLSGADSSAGYHYHDTLRHFNNLVERGGAYYLNSLLFWMSGNRTSWRYGVVPAAALGLLTGKKAVRFFNARPALVRALNRVLPTHKKMERMKLRLAACFSKN